MNTYEIHDNGSTPFIVTNNANDKYIIVKDNRGVKSFEEIKYCYLEIFIGKDPCNEKNNGNSILIKVGLERYIYIGSEIYEFMTDDIIVDYISEIGNSDVPYPYAVGGKNVYLMIEYVYFPKNICSDINDCYSIYYGHQKDVLYNKSQVKEMEYVILYERYF